MDGMETTRKLRDSGYTGVIVALTANALVGNEDVLLENGFDGFVSKPIDVRHLNAVLNKHIRDKHPEEAELYKTASVSTKHGNEIEQNKKLLQIFRNDAMKAVLTLREFIDKGDDGDIKLFTTTAHAMKSALANIGDRNDSSKAFALEKAGLAGDTGFISANAGEFIQILERLIDKLAPEEASAAGDDNLQEDTVFLKEQLAIVKNACEDYDIDTAYAALDKLLENKKQWKSGRFAAFAEIKDMLYLNSDFEAAGEMAGKLLEG
jgi:CheY-like chemotaxis protein